MVAGSLGRFSLTRLRANNFQVPKACAFCASSNRKITREHIIPEWIGELFAAVGTVTIEEGHPDRAMRSYDLTPFDQTVRAVCDQCNNGWMSRLETAVQPFLGPMIRHGRPTRLKPPQQALLARWAVKTALMAEYLHPVERIIPIAENNRFYTLQQPPAGYAVWLAHRTTYTDRAGKIVLVQGRGQHTQRVHYAPPATAEQLHALEDQGHAVYRFVLTIGHVMFLIFGHTFPLTFNIAVPDWEGFQRIWPVDVRKTWPSPKSAEEIGGFQTVYDAFTWEG